MNPPSALHGAMNRDRKPFTYTPGGIDLSEIKSERMAKRLIRNAMDQGVPETPAHLIHSPLSPTIPIQNFNCLPVQVFPTFSLPANPKSLLRTRSNPDPSANIYRIKEKTAETNQRTDLNNTDIWQKPLSEYAYDNDRINPANYGSSDQALPGYLQKEQETSKWTNNESTNKYDFDRPSSFNIQPTYLTMPSELSPNVVTDINSNITTVSMEEQNNDKEEVEIVKNQTETEDIPTKQNGDTEAAVIVKLPAKKSEAKTEKKVEISKKTLPDGSIQEVKTTITRTTIDGKTEIKTETETTTTPKDVEDDDVEYEIEEEEEEEEEEELNEEVTNKTYKSTDEDESKSNKNVCDENVVVKKENLTSVKQCIDTANDNNDRLIIQEEKHETSTKKRVTIVQSGDEKSDDECVKEIEDGEYEADETIKIDVEEEVVLVNNVKSETVVGSEKLEDEVQDVECKNVITDDWENNKISDNKDVDVTKETVNEEEEECKDDDLSETYEEVENNNNTLEEIGKTEETDTEEPREEIKNEPKEEVKNDQSTNDVKVEEENTSNDQKNNDASEDDIPIPIKVERSEAKSESETDKQPISKETHISTSVQPECTVPLEKVEEVEIKPISPAQDIIKKTHTEIKTTTIEKPTGTHSTQTEYNIIENFVTVNRTTKTLDHAYEEIPNNIPEIKSFTASNTYRTLTSPPPEVKIYQPAYSSEPQTERRHSLLLERISVDRQMPSDIYNNYINTNNQSYESQQYPLEPQSEVVVVNNVKPSAISKNQQWYQRPDNENTNYERVSQETFQNNQWQQSQTPRKPLFKCQSLSQPIQQPRPQPQLSVPPPIQNPPRVQPSPQPIYQPSIEQPPSRPTYSIPQAQTPIQPIYQPQPLYQNTYLNTSKEDYSTSNNKFQQNTYSSYPSQTVWTSSNTDSQSISNSQSNQYSYLKKETESIQKSNQEFKSSYVPPPWEQDSTTNYIVDSSQQNVYQAPSTKTSFTANQQWKPSTQINKFQKSTTSYTPPAPNQSFVKTASTIETPRMKGRKTYYSEYERRYISVPESTYIPSETKYQPQPDPSPQYYYDNNEPAEVVEPQWRKELREFTEKTTTHTEEIAVRPPWEEDPKYAEAKEFTATPTWTQTLKPRSWRERSYEPEYIGSQEWPKTNSLRRGRPQSSYVRGHVDRVPDRTRGVSVDRYNPNNYQAPTSTMHPAPATHVLDPIIQAQTYHNPSVPAYHARASVEPREQTISYQQPRVSRDPRPPPVQSRSFKYLQWITGTED